MRRVDPAGIAMAPLWNAPDCRSHVDHVESIDIRRDEELTAARERGHQEGHALGMRQAQEQVARENSIWRTDQERSLNQLRRQASEAHQRFKQLAAGLSAEVERLESLLETTAVSVAYAAVAKCLGEGYADGDAMRVLVRNAISQAGHPVVSVRLAEADITLVGALDPVAVIADPKLSVGQCVLETRYGHYESGLEVRLESTKKALLAGLDRHRDVGAGK